jgi:hypothetical protein
LKCLNCPFLSHVPDSGCHGTHTHRKFTDVSSLETWDDVLDPPPGECVIRAQGCWLARLAIVTIFIEARGEAHGESVTILSNDTCWQCARASTSLSQRQFSIGVNGLSTIRVPGVSRVLVF